MMVRLTRRTIVHGELPFFAYARPRRMIRVQYKSGQSLTLVSKRKLLLPPGERVTSLRTSAFEARVYRNFYNFLGDAL